MVRVALPYHLRVLANVESEVALELDGPATPRSVCDALEARFPMLRGTIRDHETQLRRPFIRFFACEQDLSNISIDEPFPKAVNDGREILMVVGAVAGG